MTAYPTVLITGGAGFIGSHVTEQFLEAGWQVLIVDTLATGKKENLPLDDRVHLIVGDALSLRSLSLPTLPEAVVHLAAEASVDKSWKTPRFCHEANLTATLEVLEFCQLHHIPRLVMASSAAVYGSNPLLPVQESALCEPISPYGLQKWVSEQYGHLFASRLESSVVALRLFNVFGPRQNPSSSYSGVISRFLNSFAHDTDVTIFGDGQQTRDFIYVRDVARAFFLAATQPPPPDACWVANVGTGQATSLLDVLQEMHREFPQWKGKVTHAPARSGDIRHSICQNTRIRQQFPWSPTWTFSAGMRDYFQSVRGEQASV